MQKLINNFIQNIHNCWDRKVPGCQGRPSLIFNAFKPFISENCNRSYQKRMNDNAKKVVNNPFLKAQDLLRMAIKDDLANAIRLCVNGEAWNDTRKPLMIRIDGTKTGRHYGRQIPALKSIYDYVKKCKLNTHEIYILLVSHGAKEYVVDFVVCENSHSPHEIAKSMLERFLKMVPNETQAKLKLRARIALDGAWGTGEFLLYLQSNGWKRSAIKSAGKDLVQIDGQDEPIRLATYEYETIQHLNKHPANWRSFNACHKLDGISYHEETLYLPNLDTEMKAVLYRFPSKSPAKYRYLLLLTPLVQDWHHYQMLQCYKARWPIGLRTADPVEHLSNRYWGESPAILKHYTQSSSQSYLQEN